MALAACGSKTVNTDKAETEIEKGLKQQLKLRSVSVTCPGDVEAKKGDRFDCRATSGNDKARIAVTQSDDDGNIRWRLARR